MYSNGSMALAAAVLAAGCQINAVVGENDAATEHDAARAADSSPAPDARLTPADAAPADAAPTTDAPTTDASTTDAPAADAPADVVPVAVAALIVRFETTVHAGLSGSGPDGALTVWAYGGPLRAPRTPLATTGSCAAYDNGASGESPIALGPGAVTLSVDGGADQDVPWLDGARGYTLRTGPTRDGANARVRIAIPGGPAITRTLTAATARVTTPTPMVFSGEFWQFAFTAGSDLAVGWSTPSPEGRTAEVLFVPGVEMPGTLVRCRVPATTGTLAAPWTLLGMYGGLPGSIRSIGQIILQVGTDTHETVAGIDVESISVGGMGGGLTNW